MEVTTSFLWCCVDLVATAFSMSVMFFVYRMRRREAAFRSCFFALYLAVSASECVFGLAVVLLIHLPMVTSSAHLIVDFIPCKVMSIMDYCMMFQAVAHTAIACNRFTCFAGASFHEKIWETRRARTIVFIGLCTLPLLLISLNLVIPCRYVLIGKTGLVATFVYDGFDEARTMTNICVYVTTAVASFAFNMITVVQIRRRRRLNESRSISEKQDVRLFLYSTCMTALQGLFASFYLSLLPAFNGTMYQKVMLSCVASLFSGAHCSLGPIFLVVTSPYMREAFVNFYRLRRRETSSSHSTTVHPFHRARPIPA